MENRNVHKLFSLRNAVMLMAGIFLGVLAYALHYAKFSSYFANDSESCANCHVMRAHYASWQASSHKNVATCGQCHLPQDNVAKKYLAKAENGFSHALKFTTGNYPENIVIHHKNYQIANHNCQTCHAALTDAMHWSVKTGERVDCVHCHQNAGHGVTGK